MSYVTVSFSDIDTAIKDFMDKKEFADDERRYLFTDICFRRFNTYRTDYLRHQNKDIFFFINCNVVALISLLTWINKVSGDVTANILMSRDTKTKQVYYYKSKKVEASFLKKQIKNGILIESVKNLDKESKHNCLIRIIVNSKDIEVKSKIEFITLVIIRMLDSGEKFYSYMNHTNPIEQEIINFTLNPKGNTNTNHALSENDSANHVGFNLKNLTTELLAQCMNVDNMKRAVEEQQIGGLITQTRIFNGIFRMLNGIPKVEQKIDIRW